MSEPRTVAEVIACKFGWRLGPPKSGTLSIQAEPKDLARCRWLNKGLMLNENVHLRMREKQLRKELDGIVDEARVICNEQ